jgi:hypothetical protein
MRSFFLTCLFLVFALSPNSASACKCAPPPPPDPTRSASVPVPSSNQNEAAFEGTVTAAHLKWILVEADVGDLIPADFDKDPPSMLVSFDISHVRAGAQMKTAELSTGIGGGDCGYQFEVGKQYLVYAWKDESGHLRTNICSGTDLLEESTVDTASPRGDPEISANPKARIPVPARLCGHIVNGDQADSSENRLLLISVGNRSPVPTDEAEIDADGSFCATNVAPGEYYLVYVGGADDAATSFGFFPGVTHLSDAKAISVERGQQIGNVLLKVPFQPSYSVSGSVAAFDKSSVVLRPKVALLNAEYLQMGLVYSQDLSPDGTFEFPRVLPGKYWAVVMVDGDDASKWFTTKVGVEVDNNVSGLALTLVKK